jgi:tetratricopeptide (TPR) repeat protein
VLFECLTGSRAFKGDPMAVYAKVLLDELPLVSDLGAPVSRSIDALVEHLTAKEPKMRPPDGAAALREIGMAESGTLEIALPVERRLSSAEQRVVSVLAIGDTLALSADASTVPDRAVSELGSELLEMNMNVGRLRNGSIVATMRGRGTALDDAVRAASAALRLRERWPNVPLALATGRGLPERRVPVGEVIDIAVSLLQRAADTRSPRVLVDDVTASLLETRFAIGSADGVKVLLGPKGSLTTRRTVVGKAPPLVGRARELSSIELLAGEAIDERAARALLSIGEPGLGKSRLAAEAIERICRRSEQVEVWVANGHLDSEGAAYAPIATSVRRALGLRADEPAGDQRARLSAGIEALLPSEGATRDVSAFLGELCGLPFPADYSDKLEAARRNPKLFGDQILYAWLDFAAASAARGPVVLVADDLHWFDEPSVRLLEATYRELANAPFFLLGLGRPETEIRFPRLASNVRAEVMHLAGLSKSAQGELIDAVLPELDQRRRAELVSRAGGNAFFLEELLRAENEGDSQLPETVMAVVERRLERLSTSARRLCRAASVFGMRFTLEGARALADAQREAVDELLAAEIVVADHRAPNTFEFPHALTREAAYGSLTTADRELGHRLAAAHLVSSHGSPGEIARHFELGGERARAASFYLPAARSADALGHIPAALHFAEAGVACGASGDERAELRAIQVMGLPWVDDARAESEGMALLAEIPVDHRTRVRSVASLTYSALRRHNAARVNELWREYLASRPLDLEGEVDAMWAMHHARERIRAGRQSLDVMTHRIRSLDLGRATELSRWRLAALASGRTEGLQVSLDQARLVEALGDHKRLCMHRSNTGSQLCDAGLYARALPYVEEALRGGARLGVTLIESNARAMLGRALGELGDRRALVEFDRALEVASAAGDMHSHVVARIYRASAYLRLGELEAAEAAIRGVLGEASFYEHLQMSVQGTFAAILAARDPRSVEGLAAARLAWMKSSSTEQGWARAGTSYASLLAHRGDPEGARAVVAELVRRLDAFIEAFPIAEWREELRTAPENARILELDRLLRG